MMNVLRVALDVPLPKLFDYALPDGLNVGIGDRVVVPFGTRERVGVVVERAAQSELPLERLKRVAAVRSDAPRLPADWLALVRFLAVYYQRPLGESVVACLPPRLRSLRPLPVKERRFVRLGAAAPLPNTLKPGVRRSLLGALQDSALAEEALLEVVGGSGEHARRALREALKLGWLESAPAPVEARSGTRFVASHSATAAQNVAFERIAAAEGFGVFLLHGITGSGKTEVYLRLIAQTLSRGAQALVLVPEIGLTPQLEARFRHAFPETVIVVLHSGLEDEPRTSAWLAAARGEAGIVLGTRLAVLAPLPKLALVVVDEEHDTSYKQQEGLRYSGRDAAVYRAKLAACPAVLGSATPSLESWFNCRAGRYELLELPDRASPGARLPEVRTIDLRGEPVEQGLARTLVEAIAARLARGEQSLVFINRRGYAPVLACEACGWIAGCQRCTARMVVHSVDRRLRCHYCGAQEPIHRSCPTCGNPDLHALGRGTQRVEETLAALFPRARLVRIDRDSARRRTQLSSTLEAVRRGEGDILVGTQLLAKGHDFPNLTLVGVLNADSALVSTDYRAPERLFATLVQVGGRAGRRERPGEVLVQTRYPAHPLYAALVRHDYAGFAQKQLAEREAAGFPPFMFEAALRAEAKTLAAAMQFLTRAASLAPEADGVRLYDPVPHVVTRRAGLERAQLLVQAAARPALQAFLAAWNERLFAEAPRALRWHIDVDPIEFD
jgi:primosomal protein N' (replication factor Y)